MPRTNRKSRGPLRVKYPPIHSHKILVTEIRISIANMKWGIPLDKKACRRDRLCHTLACACETITSQPTQSNEKKELYYKTIDYTNLSPHRCERNFCQGRVRTPSVRLLTGSRLTRMRLSKTPSSFKYFNPLKSFLLIFLDAFTSTAVLVPNKKSTSCPFFDRQ